MPAAERISITMPTDVAETLRQAVASGGYASTSEIAREALHDRVRKRDTEMRYPEALRAAIKAELDIGPGIPADEVIAEMRVRPPYLPPLPASPPDAPGLGGLVNLPDLVIIRRVIPTPRRMIPGRDSVRTE